MLHFIAKEVDDRIHRWLHGRWIRIIIVLFMYGITDCRSICSSIRTRISSMQWMRVTAFAIGLAINFIPMVSIESVGSNQQRFLGVWMSSTFPTRPSINVSCINHFSLSETFRVDLYNDGGMIDVSCRQWFASTIPWSHDRQSKEVWNEGRETWERNEFKEGLIVMALLLTLDLKRSIELSPHLVRQALRPILFYLNARASRDLRNDIECLGELHRVMLGLGCLFNWTISSCCRSISVVCCCILPCSCAKSRR